MCLNIAIYLRSAEADPIVYDCVCRLYDGSSLKQAVADLKPIDAR